MCTPPRVKTPARVAAARTFRLVIIMVWRTPLASAFAVVEAIAVVVTCRAVKARDIRTVASARTEGTGGAATTVVRTASPVVNPRRDSRVPQELASPSQPASHRPDRPAELVRGRVMGHSLQVAKHQRRPKQLGQPGEFLVEDLPRFAPLAVEARRTNLDVRDLYLVLLVDVAASGVGPCPHGDSVGDPMDPVAQQPGVADGFGPADQHQERRLEGILDVMFLAQDAAGRRPGPSVHDERPRRQTPSHRAQRRTVPAADGRSGRQKSLD